MLRSLFDMLDYRLAAKDGVQGTVQDFLFDDESWIVQYLVVETATALLKSKVLILPLAVGRAGWVVRQLPVLLTCEQILSSPPFEADMPIYQQRESGLKRPGCHLRSMREVLGYSLHAADGEVGNVDDFIIEDALWSVHYVVVRLKQPSGCAILVRPESIRSISLPGKAAWLNMSLPEIMNSPNAAPKAMREGDAISSLKALIKPDRHVERVGSLGLGPGGATKKPRPDRAQPDRSWLGAGHSGEVFSLAFFWAGNSHRRG